MKVLLDTHVFLWWVAADPRLSPRAGAIIRDRRNECIVSVASVWEMAIKVSLRRLAISLPISSFIATHAEAAGMVLMPVLATHAYRVTTLPATHADPFDRRLAAQALVEGIDLVTADAAMTGLGPSIIW